MPWHQVLVNLENFRFWDQICPKDMSEKKIKKIIIKFEIRIKQCMYVPDFSQFGELQFLRLNFLQKTL